MDLKDKVVVVTGSGRGLGRGMAVSFAQKGANIAVVDLNEEDIAETVKLCEEAGVKAKGYKINVAKEEEVEALFANVVADFGSLHVTINA